MFITKRFHREILEARLADKDKLIALLADEVEYLRMSAGRAQLLPGHKAVNPTEQVPMAEGAPPFVSEEEELLREMHAEGFLDDRQLEEQLAKHGFTITDIQSD